MRLEGLFSRSATVEANGDTWRVGRRGFLQRLVEASDATGATVGQFEPNSLRRGGRLRWDGRELTLRPASAWRQRYALADGDRELAILDGKSWGRRPVKISVDDLGAIDPACCCSWRLSFAGWPWTLTQLPEPAYLRRSPRAASACASR